MSEPAPARITLVGRTSAWLPRLPAGPADRGGSAPQPARGAGPLRASWVHHPHYGTLGVSLAADAEVEEAALRRGQWVQLTGLVRPHRAYALPDDPRSVVAPPLTPLLIVVTQLLLAPRRQYDPPLRLARARQDRVLPPAPRRAGPIVPLARWDDAVFWCDAPVAPTLHATWNTVRGVVTQLGGARYLRYVLSLQTPHTAE